MEDLYKLCFLCGEWYCDGIIINGENICKACEEKVVDITILDPDYDDYKDNIKAILFK